jgi:hypothetical protein
METRVARDGDCMNLAAFMRPADEAECIAAGFHDGLHALRWSLGESDLSFVTEIDGEPMAMWGLRFTSMLGQRGIPWLLTGRAVETHRKSFMKATRAACDRFMERCPGGLMLLVDPRYTRAIRWLEWLGFDCSRKQRHGQSGEMFVYAAVGGS